MLKKWFISVFPEIEKISQHLGLNLGQKRWKIEYLMKRCIGSAKPHTIVFCFFARYYDAEEVIHKRISWNWENISKSGSKLQANNYEKLNLWWKGASDPQNLTQSFFAFSQDNYDAEEVIHKGISWNWENISKSGPKFWANNNEKLNIWWKGASDPQNLTEPFFPFFARYYDAEEVIHKYISWNWENISKSGPKFGPKMMKNWIFDEKVHRIRKTSQNRISIFRKILRCWRSNS